MKFYYTKGTCSLAVRIILNELNVAYETEAVNLQTKQTEQGRDYFSINAKGSVPALFIEEYGLLTENAVIQQFLADRYPSAELLPPVGDFKRYRVLEALNFISTELHKNCSPFYNPKMPMELKATIFKPLLEAKLGQMDTLLAKTPYVCGDRFSLPDAYLFVVLTWLPSIGIDLPSYRHLQRFFDVIKLRPSVALALQQESHA